MAKKTVSNLTVIIVAAINGDMEAVRKVELDLSETGVCGSGVEGNSCCETSSQGPNDAAKTGCCGGAPIDDKDACCKLDEDKKAEGESGCGCGNRPPGPDPAAAQPS